MRSTILPALRMLLVLTVITGIGYPLVVTLFASVVCTRQAHGSIILHHGQPVGSALIGQQFMRPEYFHSRPSAIGYDPLPSSGTNFGPTSKAIQDSMTVRRRRFATENGLDSTAAVPQEMLFASGSGLDPHISPEAALMQVRRIALARAFTVQQRTALVTLVDSLTEVPELGFLGQPRVNVLRLNIALDAL